ncbi:MAG: RHS repeat-associated core domain-containing protein [Bryobacteraceae bacterium]
MRAGHSDRRGIQPNATRALTRAVRRQRNLDGTYTYDNEGKMTSVNDPATGTGPTAGPTYTYGFDNQGRPVSLTDSTSQIAAQSVVYGAAHQITSMQYTVAGSIYAETRAYNERFQLTRQTTSFGGVAQVDVGYVYQPTANNGRLTQMVDYVAGETVDYQYDSLNRLTKAETTGTQWGNSYTFDGFGNLTAKTVTKGTAPSLSINVNGATNRITTGGYSYDANGNMTAVPGVTGMVYDVDNRLTAANGELYSYAPNNQRVYKKKANGEEWVTFYGIDGRRMGAYQVLWSASMYLGNAKTEVYFAGKRLASGGQSIMEDRLGSTRKEGSTASRFYPYGEEFVPTTAEERQKFGTYWRDGGTGLDYANERYYLNNLGRFLTPDPSDSGALDGPQSLNLYAYVLGDPINYNDPEGLAPCRDFTVYAPTGANLGTVGSLLNLSTDFGILAAAVQLESSPNAGNRAEKSLVASVIINRYQVVNGVLNIVVDGDPWGAAAPLDVQRGERVVPTAFGYANSGFAGIVGYPCQFATFARTTQGQRTAQLTPGSQRRLNDALNSDQSSAECENLTSSIAAAYFAYQDFLTPGFSGFGTIDGAYLITSFNSFKDPGPSLSFEVAIPGLESGSANRFYGVPVGSIRFNGASPKVVYAPIVRAPRRPRPPRGPSRD